MADVRKMEPEPKPGVLVIDEIKLRILDYMEMDNDSVSNYSDEELAELEGILKEKFEQE